MLVNYVHKLASNKCADNGNHRVEVGGESILVAGHTVLTLLTFVNMKRIIHKIYHIATTKSVFLSLYQFLSIGRLLGIVLIPCSSKFKINRKVYD